MLLSEYACLSLFTGIGGPVLGLQRAGIHAAAFCEIEPHARAILRKHWRMVHCHHDITKLTAASHRETGAPWPNIMEGGFPCQDISTAGTGAGIHGSKSSLWFEYLRVIEEFRPAWIIAENSPALRRRGLGEILRGLAAIGYDAEWHCIPASAVGAPHFRDRIWLVAYPHVANCDGPRLEIVLDRQKAKFPPFVGAPGWAIEPSVGRVAYGVPARVDRIKRCGLASVPQISQAIGEAILAWDAAHPQHSGNKKETL